MEWVSLHTHTSFSHGDGYRLPKHHVARAKELGMDALGFTEHRNVSSHVQAEQAAKEAGIKAIFGCEFDIAPADEPRRRHFHQTVLAMNQTGYRNLNRLVGLAWEQTKYVPRLHLDQILDPELTEGLIVTSGCADSWISCTLLGGKTLGDRRDDWTDESVDETRALIQRFRKCYGDRFYLEMQMFPELERAVLLNQFFADVAAADGVPTVATADVHYPYPDQNAVQRMLHAAHRGGTVSTQDADWEYDVRLTYPESDEQCIEKLMACDLDPIEAGAAVAGAREIADRCNVELPKSERVIYIERGKQMSAPDRLREWVNDGIEFRANTDPRFAQRWDVDTDAYLERIHYEFGLLEEKGFCDYFLVCSDLVRWAKDVAKMGVGPGRGSAAGSEICYLLRITEIDPMEFPLMQFERFIDPSRPDDPDIDIDFEDPKAVFDYATSKYGAEKTSHIANYMRYRGRTSVKDVARAHELLDFSEIHELKDLIVDRDDGDPRENFSVVDAITGFERAREIVEKYPDLRMAADIEGDYRGLGIHAAGLVISTKPIVETCAIYTVNKDGKTRRGIAYDKRDAEYLGMLKLDILGLATLGLISDVLRWIGMSWTDLYALPRDNQRVFDEIFGTGDLTGIFQFDGRTTRGIVNNLAAATKFEFRHLADINALSRPGALISGQTGHYEAVELGTEEPRDWWGFDQINNVLSTTNGCLVYQEQVMDMGRAAGMPGARVGALRRIIGKKKQGGAFEAFWEEFRDGMKREVGMTEADARELWDYMAASSSYLFNIAHAVCYAVIGYWLAWLKLYYPVQFFTAALRRADKDQALALMKDAARHRVSIVPPSLAMSQLTWEPMSTEEFRGLNEDGSPIQRRFKGPRSIRAGFTQVDGIAEKVGRKMVEWRDAQATPAEERNGPIDFKLVGLTWDDMRYVAPKTGRKTKPDEPSRGVPGVGPKMIEKLRAMDDPDPFGINRAARAVGSIETAIADGDLALLGDATPSNLIADCDGDRIVFIGLIRDVVIKDEVEQQRRRTGRSAEDIRASLDSPEKTTKATIIAEDGEGIEVHVYIHRFLYPDLAAELAEVTPNTAIHVFGRARDGHGPAVQAEDVSLIELEDL
ncbi:DNA polymerase [Gordonia Phage Lollipop1437]|uniref:DnaE-like DNA polymerase III n=1 Tax=Gordonia Phage Lollipop1437 TaxID=2588505 RepID=A0A4Y6EKC0_9CAUD|nr:DNA polymerase [Gordonia Phage Lollipop1437]QDF19168.1 DnaE-like DNA polymerase III [Gordonia Phage Lollipop1437]